MKYSLGDKVTLTGPWAQARKIAGEVAEIVAMNATHADVIVNGDGLSVPIGALGEVVWRNSGRAVT